MESISVDGVIPLFLQSFEFFISFFFEMKAGSDSFLFLDI